MYINPLILNAATIAFLAVSGLVMPLFLANAAFAASCPITEPVEFHEKGSVYTDFVVDETGDPHTQRFHWPRSEENDPHSPTIPNHPEMVVVYLKYSGEPNKALKPYFKDRYAKPIDLPIFEKLEAFTLKFMGDRYGPLCKLVVPIWKYPFLRNIDPSSLSIHYQRDPDRFESDGVWLRENVPVNYLKDQVAEISLSYGPRDPKDSSEACANLDPATGKPTYPLSGGIVINFEGTEPHIWFHPDCEAKRIEKFGTDREPRQGNE